MTTSSPSPSKPVDTLSSHPRLHVGPDAWQQLASIKTDSWYAPYIQKTAAIADGALDAKATLDSFNNNGHNWHLIRARCTQTYTWSLIVQYRLTGEAKYKDAVMAYVQIMHDWEYWSWISWRKGENDPRYLYDLSYGENSATLAIINDWLWSDLTPEDKKLLMATIRRPVDSFMHRFIPKADGSMYEPHRWFGLSQSNWNTVCAGGIGMLALSFYEELPEAKRIIELVEESIVPYIKEIEACNGGWPEGIGYWNYGMRYAFMYLLSWERATGQKHWGLEQPATVASLQFPVDFCPNGVPCSFSDVNQWTPLAFHQAVARRVGADDLAGELFRMHPQLSPAGVDKQSWPNTAETLLLLRRVITDTQPDAPAAADAAQDNRPLVKLYAGQDWGIISDRQHSPNLYMTVRGGSTTAPHGHIDVTSFHAGVDDESIIFNQGVNEYLDTTFSPRRFDLYDTTPASKNVVLISGAGLSHPSTVVTKQVELSPTIAGLHIDATSAMGQMRDGPAVVLYSRLYLMIDNQAMLVVDHVVLPQPGRFESRLHTPMQISPSLTHVQCIEAQPATTRVLQLTGRTEQAQLHLACSEPAKFFEAMSLSTSPHKGLLASKSAQGVRVIRWIGQDLYSRIAFATLIVPGQQHANASSMCEVNTDEKTQGVDVSLNLPWGQKTLKLNAALDALH